MSIVCNAFWSHESALMSGREKHQDPTLQGKGIHTEGKLDG